MQFSFFPANFTFCLVFYLEIFFFFRFPVFVSMATEVKLQDGTAGFYTKWMKKWRIDFCSY